MSRSQDLPNRFSIGSEILTLLIVFFTLCGILCVTAVLNRVFIPIQPYFFIPVLALALVAAFVMGGYFQIKRIGREVVIIAALIIGAINFFGFVANRGLTILPLLKTTRIDLGTVINLNYYFFLWVMILAILAYMIKSKHTQAFHARVQRVTIPLMVFFFICGIIYFALICFTPNNTFSGKGIPSFSYTAGLQARAKAYQKAHYSWRLENWPGQTQKVQVKSTDSIGWTDSYTDVLDGANDRLESGPYSISYNKEYGIWFVRTYPRRPRQKGSQDYYTHLLVRNSDGLVLAKW